MKNVISEIVTFHTHSDSEVVIYTKDVYIEDGSMFFLNISSITITSHPDFTLMGRRALIIPTQINQISFFRKSPFHILNQTYLENEGAIDSGDFPELASNVLDANKISILLYGTSFYLSDINIYREETIPDKSYYCIMAIQIQERMVKTGNFLKYHSL